MIVIPLEDDVEALRLVCKANYLAPKSTKVQVASLVKITKPLFQNRSERLEAISFLIGREIKSLNDLNVSEASFLLNENATGNLVRLVEYAALNK